MSELLFSDWLVKLMERKRGKAFKQRQVVFFVIFLGLALVSFRLLQHLFAPA
jgi:hypothetical protein